MTPPPPLLLSWSTLRRGRREVLRPASTCIPVGSVVGLVGANGAGKSTLLMAVAGVLAGRCGSAVASIDGAPLATIGYLPQQPRLPPWLSVREGLALNRSTAAEIMAQDAELAPLLPLLDRSSGSLSGGEAQLLTVLGAVGRADPLLLLDEPFTGVGMAFRPALVAAVADYRRRLPGAVVVLASHLAVDIHALCDRLLVIRDGDVVFDGPRSHMELRSTESSGGRDERIPTAVTLLERELAALLA